LKICKVSKSVKSFTIYAFFVLLKFSEFISVFRGEGGSKSLEKKDQKAGGQSRAYNNQKIKNQNFKKSKINFNITSIDDC
jgi:hypothetical protein